MAQASGKQFGHWHKLKSTNSYLKTLESVITIPITSLVQVIQGGDPQNQGTWGHPKGVIMDGHQIDLNLGYKVVKV
jgi:hypothetical protein